MSARKNTLSQRKGVEAWNDNIMQSYLSMPSCMGTTPRPPASAQSCSALWRKCSAARFGVRNAIIRTWLL